MSKNIIVVLSLGRRPWVDLAYETIRLYAGLHGLESDLIREDRFEDFTPGPFRAGVGRHNKRAYALKSFIPWYYISQLGYDRVIMVDDTCVFSPHSDNIFSISPFNSICYTGTSKSHAEESFDFIRTYDPEFPSEKFDPEHYGNSGLVVYSRPFIEAFSPDRIIAAQELLHARFPHQTLLYYLTKKSDIPVCVIPKTYNMIPLGSNRTSEDRRDWSVLPDFIRPEEHFVIHFSNAFRNRESLIKDAARVYLDAWSSVTGSATDDGSDT